jgi:uncharacterized protein YecT (DUF1311 family)
MPLALVALLAAAVLTPPVIRETFTLLPCPKHPVSTLDLEGCSEQAIVRTDRKIDAQAKAIFTLLRPDARPTFVRGERAWLQYRQASCLAESSKYAGGTLSGVVAASCTLARSKSHLSDLVDLRKTLSGP